MIPVLIGSGYVMLLLIFCRLGDVVDELRELNRCVKKERQEVKK